MATTAELRARIQACREKQARQKEIETQAIQEVHEAEERQKLRRELEREEATLRSQQQMVTFRRNRKAWIDQDLAGSFLPEGNVALPSEHTKQTTIETAVDCNESVVRGELVWCIKGFSWLRNAMKQECQDYAESDEITVADHAFNLAYNPRKRAVGGCDQRASLAIVHQEPAHVTGVTFRYELLLKSRERGFVQWGATGDVCVVTDADLMAFGPDVCSSDQVPRGVFGLTHAELCKSEWVEDDTLTVKLQVEVRPFDASMSSFVNEHKGVDVPSSGLADHFLALLDSDTASDVRFLVDGETIKAHSLILSARSEVFQRQFTCGMRESVLKEVVVEDCDPSIFKAFLRFIYSDSFAPLEEAFKAHLAPQSSGAVADSESSSNACRPSRPSLLQKVLAVSHKYQIGRLQAWCENELCFCISVEEVSSVLSQAYLLEARKLEEVCLDFIKARMDEVVKSSSFAVMVKQWPDVMLKIGMRVGGVSEASASVAMEAQQKKRKREE